MKKIAFLILMVEFLSVGTGFAANEDDVDRANILGRWISTENQSVLGLHSVQPFQTSRVSDQSQYSLSSSNDPDYASAKTPTSVSYRWRAFYAPNRKNDLKIGYHVFLTFPTPLENGKSYTLSVGDIGLPSSSFNFTFSDDVLNENIKVNQVGYLPSSKKIATVGQFLGTGGAMSFDVSRFEVRNSINGAVVYSGVGSLGRANDSESGENVYNLDFSALTTPGIYVVKLPGTGLSHPFRIGSDVYNEVLSLTERGAYHTRSGTSLDMPYTRFTHAPSHTTDATVLSFSPIPDWFSSRYGTPALYPTTLAGQRLNATKGHYDAGDYGKYTVSGAFFVGDVLSGFEAFPDHMMKDDLNIPESGNGIPDLLDEVKWEMDWLENMQDPVDGGVFCMVKPDGAFEFYENRAVDDPLNLLHRVMYPKDTTCTGAYAAAMAKAARSVQMKNFFPNDTPRYLAKAQKAWDFLEKNPGFLAWHHYGAMEDETDKSLDDRVWASLELYGATGDQKFHNYFLTHHKPETNRWGWIPLFASFGQASIAAAFMNQPALDPSMKARCVAAVKLAGDQHVTDSQKRSYRLSISDDPLTFGSWGWIFPQERIFQLLMANAVAPNPTYLQTALYNWDFLLGENPLGLSYFTGIGSKRPREVVHTQSWFDRIEPPVPGLPIGLASSNSYIEAYGSKPNTEVFPNHPPFRLTIDGWNINAEFTTPEIALGLVAASYLATTNDNVNQPPSINSLNIPTDYVAAPQEIILSANVSDPDGSVVRYHWDFDDGSFSTDAAPKHMFREPDRVHNGALTITDNDGAETVKTFVLRTKSATPSIPNTPFVADANTLALFHFDNSLEDATGHGYKFAIRNTATMDSNNLSWMGTPAGQSLRLNGAFDGAVVQLPRAAIWPNAQSALTVEAFVYVEDYDAYSESNAHLFGLDQDYNRALSFFEDMWVGRDIRILTPNAGTVLLKQDQINTLMPVRRWVHLAYVIANGKSWVMVNGKKVAEIADQPAFEVLNSPIDLKTEGFRGWIDEIRISNVVRPEYILTPPPPASTHPADKNADLKISLDEATAYGFCWKSLPTIPANCPAQTTLDTAVRAGFLWASSPEGRYQFDSTQICPSCWNPAP